MNAEQLLERYANGTRDFSGADLRGVDLTHASLVNINLYRADLTNAVLEQADLRGANFLKADLTNANLTAANLAGANLRRAELTGTILKAAILDAARFSDVVMPDGLPSRDRLTVKAQPGDRQSNPFQYDRLKYDRLKYARQQSLQQRRPRHPSDRVTSSHRFNTLSSLDTFHNPPAPTIAELPLPSLALLWAGYCCFGGILGLYDAPDILWMLVWGTALMWMLGDSMVWFIPVIAAIAVMLASGVSLWAFILAVSVSIGLGAGLLLLGWSTPKALKDSLWVGGLVVVAINLAQWLFRGDPSGITLSGYFPLAFLLIIGMGSTGMGAIAWLQMSADGFRRRQIAWTFSGCAALGLLCGGLISQLLLPPI